MSARFRSRPASDLLADLEGLRKPRDAVAKIARRLAHAGLAIARAALDKGRLCASSSSSGYANLGYPTFRAALEARSSGWRWPRVDGGEGRLARHRRAYREVARRSRAKRRAGGATKAR
jgi:hypothetical protein